MSMQKVSSTSGSCSGTTCTQRGCNSLLELEADAAVRELSFAVETIAISEILPRTSDLIFVNVTTVEGQHYCLELTLKGWRITSLRPDCMAGDFTRLELFIKYYESFNQLIDEISPGYRNRFAEELARKLTLLQCEDDDWHRSPSLDSSKSFTSSDSLPIVTPTSTPTLERDRPQFSFL